MKKCLIAILVFGSFALLTIGVITAILVIDAQSQEDEPQKLIADQLFQNESVKIIANEIVDWSTDGNLTEPPPNPLYNVGDSAECRDVIEGYYEQATSSQKRNKENGAKLNASYQGILDKQAEYGIELVDNQAFLDWTYEDYEDSW